MRYDLGHLPIESLLAPVTAATSVLVRLDERIGRSDVGAGLVARLHFADAVASLWVDGELVHLEDLVLHDAAMGVRTPTHEVSIAQDVLRTRRRILAQPPGWALSAEGLGRLRGQGDGAPGTGLDAEETERSAPERKMAQAGAVEGEDETAFHATAMADADPFEAHLAAMDAVLARTNAVLAGELPVIETRAPPTRDPFLYEPDWDEEARLEEWREVLHRTEDIPPVLRAVLLVDAWNELRVLQHAPWLGRLLAAALLRQVGLTQAYLVPVNLGLKQIARERRAAGSRDQRLVAALEGLSAAAETGLKEHDRLLLARQQMEHRLAGRRSSSKLPQVVELVLSRPMVTARMIAEEIEVTPQGALKIVGELNLRELTGRGRFRAWGII
ncbi:RHE_PE00001 family protein [Rhizobium halophytocola]|uniref:DUF1612 domain-containing protein n=1 Tax=Rhizobium halophytocola TaxID=735519 RepID=A0ABS4DUU9_9HYPH|nr:RHE_PE00001 family protein [Rhizobium halophytocola]MBP1849467.1 hypothetical protein [Rhizobium halophytocola]